MRLAPLAQKGGETIDILERALRRLYRAGQTPTVSRKQ